MDALKRCLAAPSTLYGDQIKRNTAYARELLKKEFTTPSIFVDGIRVENPLDYDSIKKLIESQLKKVGK